MGLPSWLQPSKLSEGGPGIKLRSYPISLHTNNGNVLFRRSHCRARARQGREKTE